MGACPDWYSLLRAGKYLGVAPWDLAERSLAWQQWALTAEAAETEAQEGMVKEIIEAVTDDGNSG